ncbi:hypothetical protein SMICM17S_11048 [Streptomyces microflavus]
MSTKAPERPEFACGRHGGGKASWEGCAGRASGVAVSAQVEDARVQHLTLLERGPDRPVQPVLQVQIALPLHDVGEQVAVERGVLGEEVSRSSWPLVVTSWSRRTGRGATSAHCRVDSRPWSGYGFPFPMRLKITRKAYRARGSGRSQGTPPRCPGKGRRAPHSAGYRDRGSLVRVGHAAGGVVSDLRVVPDVRLRWAVGGGRWAVGGGPCAVCRGRHLGIGFLPVNLFPYSGV